jgi:hypothetical protein
MVESTTKSPPANIVEIPDMGIAGFNPVNGSSCMPNTSIVGGVGDNFVFVLLKL